MDIKVPPFPESVDDGEIANWRKQTGESFSRDEVLVEIETDKVVLEVPAPKSGTLSKIIVKAGETVKANQIIGEFEPAAIKDDKADKKVISAPQSTDSLAKVNQTSTKAGPAARRLAQETGVNMEEIANNAKKGELVTKQDVVSFISQNQFKAQRSTDTTSSGGRIQKRVPMTRLRASVAKRLVESQQTAAMLTTFNEVNMTPIMELRTKYKKQFEEKHNGTRLGFMSFFVKGAVLSLAKYPEVNAYIEDNDIVYHNYYDLGIAVSSPRGLVVPILRDVQSMSLADIESQINQYALKAKEGKLALEELQGGTFTISNGGVFGSLLSTPIINPPQTAILGMHKIQERPVAVNGKVVILPMMYLALTYDHRMIDGKTAVKFLVTIKDFLENPGLILLDI